MCLGQRKEETRREEGGHRSVEGVFKSITVN